MPNLQLDFGHILEGVLERDPMTDRLQVHTVTANGDPVTVDVLSLLESYLGQEVKLTLASMETLQRLAEALGDGEGVMALMPEDVPGATVSRTFKPAG